MIRQLIKYYTVLILLVNLGCVNINGNTTVYKSNFTENDGLCIYIDPQLLQPVIQLNVPYIAQEPDYCGPASAAMVLGYMGSSITQDEIGAGIVGSSGIDPLQLRDRVAVLGYNMSIVSCGFNNLLSLLGEGKPVIVRILNNKKDNGHYVVVTGYDMVQKIIYVNDPEDIDRKSISFDNFRNLWDINTLGTDYNSYNLMLIISISE
jgi:hypothetical protein